MTQTRLDILLCERNLAPSREKAQALIMAGTVWAKDRCLDKPGLKVASDLELEVRKPLAFVSRGGLKLAHALDEFAISVKNKICLDIGASTGGFTDCLLQRGAERVFAVDVGKGQLDYKLQKDPRVSALEKLNARFLTLAQLSLTDKSAEQISFVCADVSFISLRKILPALLHSLQRPFQCVLLFKPQFEVGREFVLRGGVVRDDGIVRAALDDFNNFMTVWGLRLGAPPLASPITGKKSGNQEYLLFYEKTIH